jgi:hypothetical protein
MRSAMMPRSSTFKRSDSRPSGLKVEPNKKYKKTKKTKKTKQKNKTIKKQKQKSTFS